MADFERVLLGGTPHKFGNNKKLKFSDHCKGKTLYEFPLLHGDNIYKGGDPGADRVVFFVHVKDPFKDGTKAATYCGVMTHTGAPKGEFHICPQHD